MKTDIKKFLRRICRRYGLEARYMPDEDIYFIHKRGFAIQTFTTDQFYEIPPRMREKMFLPLIKRGLAHNLGEESVKDTLVTKTAEGIKVA